MTKAESPSPHSKPPSKMGEATVDESPLEEACPFSMGDHVYQWCSVAFLPLYQHHGIVLDTYKVEDQWMLKIMDFSNDQRQKKNISGRGGGVRTYVSDATEWHTVTYTANLWQRTMHRAGTCTAVRSDPPGLVRARAQYLLEHPEVLPKYDAVQSNCECVAVWCKTGTFATLQASSWLSMTSAGQVKSAVTVGSVAAATQVTVPSAGLWGWLGYTTHVSLLTAQPVLLPAIATYGVVTAGVPAVVLAVAKHSWKNITKRLNESFWDQAIEQPDIFVECITYWSEAHEPMSLDVKEIHAAEDAVVVDSLLSNETTIAAAHAEATTSLFSSIESESSLLQDVHLDSQVQTMDESLVATRYGEIPVPIATPDFTDAHKRPSPQATGQTSSEESAADRCKHLPVSAGH